MMLFILTLTPLFVAMHLFGFTLNYYFFQDDWFNFNITNINSIKDYLNFFAFRDDIIAYRPLVLQTQYFLFRSIFGLNAFALRVINFSLLFISYILVMYLARRILKNSKSALESWRLPSAFSKVIGFILCDIVEDPTSSLLFNCTKYSILIYHQMSWTIPRSI